MNCGELLPKWVKRIGIVGVGRSNLSLLKMLPRDTLYVIRSDNAVKRSLLPKWLRVEGIYEGERALADITEDALILSPSVRRDRPELASAMARGVIVTSDSELFFERVAAPVLAVSGSSGKSTTATLAYEMLGGEAAGAVLSGNVGRPMVETLSKDGRIYVCELSSFMLSYHKATLRRSVLTGITENHLDWHRDFEEYCRTKLSLFALSRECVANVDDPILGEYGRNRELFSAVSIKDSLGELAARQRADIYMTLDRGWLCRNGERLLHVTELKRQESYNITNALCALALTDGLCDRDEALSALRSFGGLEHRCEVVHEASGIRYINSSIDTTPERCAVTLSSIEGRGVLLLGGRGKGLSYECLVGGVSRFARIVVAFGEERENIYKAFCGSVTVEVREKFCDAVACACAMARSGESVVLSPANTSYDEFSSFEERGAMFCELVREYAEEKS
ncbi:MAG: UDP-N-acetylmuramoyl-L-alanine--D-glutamate ligase [Clostridia bacterium]|nr:UDP-N-acetylmuramoyl-L-alanine--D-glutamate ligase [Clostridia bacterium]